jgi:hypothetical protein
MPVNKAMPESINWPHQSELINLAFGRFY